MGLSALSSCKKDSESAPSKTSLLTAKSWKTTDVKIDGISVYNTPLIDACEKDDLVKFNTDKTSTYDQGTLRCVSTDPQTAKGSWDFTTNETKLKLTDPDGDVTEANITTLTNTSLVLTEPDFMGSGKTAELTLAAQ
ncbi:lipocalin family protein [Microvirga sp. STS02]|uniref:lipocalin family protein n=1 Tax=Hymenobacter negativus TaxID=2795026 RepID=UPI0018DE91F7|nr:MULTISPECIES: lipocalin family protein [Bacteria]MBH8570459.1 lipocalin family protein [Hymenobacter negativus]MBR7210198.1 lipocalin family protein [Microvirga sp. STS02]